MTDRDTILVADFVNTTGNDVFDGTLRQALVIQLEQSPFLSLVSRQQMEDTLRAMTRSPDERVVDAVAREACQRLGAKVTIAGSIAPIGTHFAMGLEAVNCHSGESVATEQAEAPDREQVLKTLGAAASRLRRKLGESLASIQRFDAPITQATTPSLEALKAFSVAEETRARTGDRAAMPFYLRAIELDPDFATAYARLSAIYGNLNREPEMLKYASEAYARRDRVSERERLYIDGRGCSVRVESDCYQNVHELWKRTYPRDWTPVLNLCFSYNGSGQYEKALENCLLGMRLSPDQLLAYTNLHASYLNLGRPAEARQVLDKAVAKGLGGGALHVLRFMLAFAMNDLPAMDAERRWAAADPEGSALVAADADVAAFGGQFRRSRELRARAVAMSVQRQPTAVATIRAREAFWDAASGFIERARAEVPAAGVPSEDQGPLDLRVAALLTRDRALIDQLFRQATASAQGANPYAGAIGVVRAFRDAESRRSGRGRSTPQNTVRGAPEPHQLANHLRAGPDLLAGGQCRGCRRGVPAHHRSALHCGVLAVARPGVRSTGARPHTGRRHGKCHESLREVLCDVEGRRCGRPHPPRGQGRVRTASEVVSGRRAGIIGAIHRKPAAR